MLKVMHVLNTGSYSGAENVVITLINATKENVSSIYVSYDGSIREYLNENAITFEPIKKMSVEEIKRVIKKTQPDIIHAHDFTAGIICSLATNKPIINHIHNNSPWIKRINTKSLAYAISCLRYKKILTVSNSVMDEFVFGRRFKRKTMVVGNPIDLDRIRRLAGNPKAHYDVAFLGRLSAAKNPDKFIDIIIEAKKQNPNITAIMIGDGELRSEIENRIKKGKLGNTVTMLGFQKNPYQYLKQARLLCMPSNWEGFGLSAVEALSLGIPVIASPVGGLKDFISSDYGALCVTEYDYSEAITSFLMDSVRYQNASQAAIDKAEAMANLTDYAAKMCALYQEIQ